MDPTKIDPTKGLNPNQIQQQIKAAFKKAGIKNQKHPRNSHVPFRHVIQFDWNRRFTWKERLQIFMGYSLNVLIRVPTLHNPGELGVLVMAETSEFEKPSDEHTERMKKAMRETFSDAPIEDEPTKSNEQSGPNEVPR